MHYSKLPSLPDEVIVGGGAAVFLEPELEAYFNCEADKGHNTPQGRLGERPRQYKGRDFSSYADLVWLGDIQTQIEGMFKFEKECNQLLSLRLLDAFGMMDQLKDTVKEAAQNAQSQSQQST